MSDLTDAVGGVTDVVLKSFGVAAETVADLSGVPGLPVAVGLVNAIITTCQNVPRNRRAAQQLADDCGTLVNAIEAASQDKEPHTLKGIIESLLVLLKQINEDMETWASYGFWKSLWRQGGISEGIVSYGQKIDRMLATFHVTADIEVFNVLSKLDRADAYKTLSGPENQKKLEEHAFDARTKGHGGDVEQVMNMVVEDLRQKNSFFDEVQRKGLETNLVAISQTMGVLPPNLEIPSSMVKYETVRMAGSILYDVFKGTYMSEPVAVKRARDAPESVEHIIKEARNWRSACKEDPQEDHILQLVGISFPGQSFMMLSRWMDNRDVGRYLEAHPDVDRRALIRNIAKGLRILHTQNPPISHGDLKASNIIVNNSGRPLLGDFGLSKVLSNGKPQVLSNVRGMDSWRWFAPEVVDGEGVISTHSDIYSFAMTVVEIMTGKHPLNHIRRTHTIALAIVRGERPRRPLEEIVQERGLKDELWNLLTRCWVAEPEKRPDIHEVIRELDRIW